MTEEPCCQVIHQGPSPLPSDDAQPGQARDMINGLKAAPSAPASPVISERSGGALFGCTILSVRSSV
jgi:hypothetical protein